MLTYGKGQSRPVRGCSKDTVIGNTARNVIAGYDGHDILVGYGGNEDIVGRNGNDTIIGGTGQDALAGSAGYDVFRFDSVSHSTRSSPDNITDFQRGCDKMDLSRMDADTDTAGNQTFKFIGSKVFTGIDSQLRSENGYVYGDLNVDRTADFTIRFIGAEVLVGSCIIL
ncbi:M10 family metallopeptidase C-terminal domain-containing protein [Microvirga vignae]|uniref:M10 family metallopeptidase C-terminal domain-containing protein n=1 Tax=Microvirga vignae TaxID=1225564 RepID=UPI0006997FA1|nr:M10 family metallopeptidase C-terminal domain-containing protein [Microvirga vignae]